MDSKLTLKFDKEVIEKAKEYAKMHGISLSKAVENYFHFLVKEGASQYRTVSPVVKELSGVITLEQEYDRKGDYGRYLTEKYS